MIKTPKKRTIMLCYANYRYYLAQQRLLASARQFNDFDEYYAFAPWDVDSDFRKTHAKIFENSRGDGYRLWKPYFINQMLDNMAEGEILFYIDSDAYFIDSCKPLIELCRQEQTPIISFSCLSKERIWTKRDCFIALDCDSPEYSDSVQTISGYSLWRKSSLTVQLAKDWLYYMQNYHLVSDSPSDMPNHPGFIEHRHDQSVFSLLCKKYAITPYRDPCQHGNQPMDEPILKNPLYPQILHLDRKISTPLRLISKRCFHYMWKTIVFDKMHYGHISLKMEINKLRNKLKSIFYSSYYYTFIITRLQNYYLFKRIPKESESYIMIKDKADRAGSQVMAKYSAILYARNHGVKYVYAPFEKGHIQNEEELEKWDEFFNVSENEIGINEIKSLGIRSISLMSITSMLLGFLSFKSQRYIYTNNHFHVYTDRLPNQYTKLQDMFRLKYDNSLKEYELHNDPQRINIAVHIRRGDVDQRLLTRFTQNSSIRKGLLKITQILAHLEINHKISIYSQGKIEEFQELEDLVEEFYLDHDAFSTFHNLVKADVLIMAKSSFSYAAALLSKGIILYEPMWNKPLEKWIVNSDGAFEEERFREQMKECLAI